MVPARTTLTLDVKGQAGQWFPRTPGEIRGQVMNDLTPFFQVFDIALTSGSDNPLATFGLWNWTFTAVVQLATIEAYAESDDVASIVASAFYDASGTVPAVTVRGHGVQQVPDIDTSPDWLSIGSLAAIGLAALAVMIYIPRPR